MVQDNLLENVSILSTGSFLPPWEIDNETLWQYYYTDEKESAWIHKKTGIKSRRMGFDLENNVMRDGYFDLDLAENAANLALKKANLSAKDLDLIVYTGCTSEFLYFPDSACALHERLGASMKCAAYSLPSGCGGLGYAIKSVESQIKGKGVDTALIVATNTPSSFMNVKDTKSIENNWLNAAIFGDGASSIILSKNIHQRTIIKSWWGCTFKNDPMKYPAGGSKNPTKIDNIYGHTYQMDGRMVFQEAPIHLINGIDKVLEDSGYSIKDVKYFLMHQANLLVLRSVQKKLKLKEEKILINLDRYGNTAAASIGILLDEAINDNLFKPDDLILISAIGAGWHLSSFLVKW